MVTKIKIVPMPEGSAGWRPMKMSEGASAYDVFARKTVVIPANGRNGVPLGFAVEAPSHIDVQLRPRSGLAIRNGITLVNSPGTIDSDYRGELFALMVNLTDHDYKVCQGDRVAQLVFGLLLEVDLVVEENFSGHTNRGDEGFGSTGR